MAGPLAPPVTPAPARAAPAPARAAPSPARFVPTAAPTNATPSPAGVVLRVRNLHKRYGNVHALAGVNLEIRRGETVGFLGPNGAGKTTFTKCVVGFLKPNEGSIELMGHDVQRDARSVLENVGVVPDQYDFYGNLNGRQHLDFYGRLYGVPRSERRARIDETLDLVGMHEFSRRRVRGYSHGMKQRLCIAQALLNRPEFIIFDEPTNGLDPRGAYETRELIKRLRKQGTTIFLSSHILSEVEDVCTRVAILSRGRILVEAGVGELRRTMRGNVLRVNVTLANPSPQLERIPVQRGVAQRATLSGNVLACELGPDQKIPELVAALAKQGAEIQGVHEEEVGLEEIFLELTKGEGGL